MVPTSDFPSVFIAQVQILNRPKVQDIVRVMKPFA
jgi:hypothetical protein